MVGIEEQRARWLEAECASGGVFWSEWRAHTASQDGPPSFEERNRQQLMFEKWVVAGVRGE